MRPSGSAPAAGRLTRARRWRRGSPRRAVGPEGVAASPRRARIPDGPEVLHARRGDALECPGNVRVAGLQRLGHQKLALAVVDVSHAAIDQAELLVQVSLDGAVPAHLDGL